MDSFHWARTRLSWMRLLAFSLIASLFAAGGATAQNTCADAYWQDTLRCAAYPNEQPQANLNSPPTNLSELKDFARVILPRNPAARCLDGTRSIIYVDKAVCVNAARCTPGESRNTNKWIISVTGGGSCHARDSDGDGVVDDAQDCLDEYQKPKQRDEMGTALQPPMKNLNGINKPDPTTNPVFANYNRIRVEKCSFDRFNGRAAYAAAGGYFHETGPNNATVDFDMYQQGYPIMEDVIALLQNGLTYTTWTNFYLLGMVDRVVGIDETLPPLSEAKKVLFVGHSGGAHGLYHNIDHLAANLASIPGFTGDVRVLYDANFVASIENEAAFATDASGAPLNGNAYSNLWAGETSGSGTPFGYDGAAFYTSGQYGEQYRSWNAVFDTSCLAAHAATGDDWKCHDRYHMLFNHIATPFFFREDFSDPNLEHTDDGDGHPVFWADETEWSMFPTRCPTTLCPPSFSAPSEHRIRLETQFDTLLNGANSQSELATGADPSLAGIGSFPAFYAWMPDCGSHGGAYNDKAFFDTIITSSTTTSSMREWLETFMSAGRANLSGTLVDGRSNTTTKYLTIYSGTFWLLISLGISWHIPEKMVQNFRPGT